MAQNWTERRCTMSVVEGRESFLVVRQAPTAELPPALTSAAFEQDRLFAGYNDGSVRCWSLAEARADGYAQPPPISDDSAGVLGGAAGVHLMLREQRSLVWPSSSRAADQPNYVSTIRTAGARVFTAHAPFAFLDASSDDEDGASAAAS